MSSPNINNLIIAGCIIAYLSVILFAVDGEHLTSLICEVCVLYLILSRTIPRVKLTAVFFSFFVLIMSMCFSIIKPFFFRSG